MTPASLASAGCQNGGAVILIYGEHFKLINLIPVSVTLFFQVEGQVTTAIRQRAGRALLYQPFVFGLVLWLVRLIQRCGLRLPTMVPHQLQNPRLQGILDVINLVNEAEVLSVADQYVFNHSNVLRY